MRNEGDKRAEEFRSGGIVPGMVGMVCVVVVVGIGVTDPNLDFPLWGFALAVLAMVGLWALMIRPSVRLGATELQLRNVLHDRVLPYALIDDVEITQVTRVRVGDAEFVGSGFGRSRRAIRGDARLDVGARDVDHSVGWIVEERIRRRIADAAPVGPDVALRRTWVWPVVGGLAGSAVLTLVLLALGV